MGTETPYQFLHKAYNEVIFLLCSECIAIPHIELNI